MNYKEEIQNLLNDLKKVNISRFDVEKELGYSENYITQQLSKGANVKLYKAILRYHKTKDIKNEPMDYKEKYIASLERENESLRNELKSTSEKLKSNLEKILTNQYLMIRQISAATDLEAQRFAGQDKKKYKEEMDKLDKYILGVQELK